MPVCPVDCITAVEYEVPAAALAEAKTKAKAFAANQRQMKQERDAIIARTLAKIPKVSTHA